VTDADAKTLRKTMDSRVQRDNVDCTITNWSCAGTTLKIALACAREQARGKRVGRLLLMHRSRDTHRRPLLRRKLECITALHKIRIGLRAIRPLRRKRTGRAIRAACRTNVRFGRTGMAAGRDG